MRLTDPNPHTVALIVSKAWDLSVYCGERVKCGKTRTWTPDQLAAEFPPGVTAEQIAERMNCPCGAGWGWTGYRQNHASQREPGGQQPARADTLAMPDLHEKAAKGHSGE